MKNILIILISMLFLTSCDFNPQNNRPGYIVSTLSKQDKVAISDGSDIFLVTKDSTINDSTKLKIFFATKSIASGSSDHKYHTGIFTVYKCGRYGGIRGGAYTYYFYVTDGEKSIELQSSINELAQEQKVFVVYCCGVTFPTYKTVK